MLCNGKSEMISIAPAGDTNADKAWHVQFMYVVV